jgi:hypothetical protein
MATEPQPASPFDARRDSEGKPRTGGADIAPLGPRGENPLHLHAAELDVLRRLRASGHLTDVEDPVWDELETLGFVEIHVLRCGPDGTPTRSGKLTSLGRRYRTG